MNTLLIKNGTILTALDEFTADIFIKDGIIEKIGTSLEDSADQVVDATGKYVFPGGVDQHTHFDFTFGSSTCVGWESSDAAVVSGTTTVIDFVNQRIGWSIRDSVDKYLEEKVVGKACCDYGFHGVVYDPTDDLFNEIQRLPDYGIPTIKLFMAYRGHPYHCDDDSILKALQASVDAGVTIMVHAENADMIDALQKQTVKKGITAPIGHAISRPPIVETEAVHRAAYLAKLAEAPIYIVHVTAKEAMAVIREEYAKGTGIFGETCTHYLVTTMVKLDQPDFEGAKFVCSPALRTKDHLDELWTAVRKGWLNAISSDHVGFNWAVHKHAGKDSFINIPNGAPGLENRIPMVWTEGVAKGRISRQKFVEVCCTNPAKINGMFPKKGTIAVGSDGDLVIFDPDYRGIISNENSLHRVDFSAYEGREQIGRAEKVFLRGELVAENGKYLGRMGSGRFISGKPFGLCYELR
ncbi:MAG: dihydropyrimidinase [Eubacteriales bacterium]|nr:dihydropyrimidinase [Eubacteriales bacterium]